MPSDRHTRHHCHAFYHNHAVTPSLYIFFQEEERKKYKSTGRRLLYGAK